MIYFLVGLLMIVYLELLGQSFLSLIGKERKGFSFGAGFVLVLAVSYLSTSLLTAMNCSFYLILAVYTVLLLLGTALIVRQRKSLAVNFHLLELFFVLLTIGTLLFYSLKTGFGDLDGFDSTFYLNMVTNNIGLDRMNSRNVYYGDHSFSIQLQYTFQSYYYLSSVLIYYIEKICSLFHVPFYRVPCFVWPNQILFFAMSASLITDALRRIKERSIGFIALSLILVVFYFGRLYFYNAFGFYGNSLRVLLFGQACCYLLDHNISKNKTDRYIFYLALSAVCACSSSGVFSCFFFLFALFFLWTNKEENLLKEYAAALLFPAINLIAVLRDSVYQGIAAAVVLSVLLYFLNRPIHTLTKNVRNRYALLVVCVLAMIVLSYLVDGKLFHYDAFVMNYSQRYDMTLNYFYFPNMELVGIRMYKCIILLVLAISILFIRNDITNVDLILILIFFNPFCCAFLNKINPVFYRSYDIMINPFSITFLLNACGNLIPVKYAKEGGTILLAVCLLKFANLSGPIYYHDSFVPGDSYNAVYRMSQEELETIDALSNEIKYHNDENPKIITANKLTQSMLRSGVFIYGRENKPNPSWGKAENELFNIFYPVEQYYQSSDRPEADFNHICEYLKDADIRYVVQDKLITFYDEEQKVWYSMTYLVDRCGEYAFYENERYSVYRFDWEK